MNGVEIWLVIVGVVSFLYWLPYLATALGFTFFYYTASEDGAPPNDTQYQLYHQDLIDAGFRHVGEIRERVFFTMDRLILSTDVVMYRSACGLVYVSLYRLPGDRIVRALATAYGADWLHVKASMPGAGWEFESHCACRIEVPSGGIPALLQRHAEVVEAFTAGRTKPVAI